MPDRKQPKRPGWYRHDDEDSPTYWDGEHWTDRKFDQVTSSVTLPLRPTWQVALIVVVAVVFSALLIAAALLG